MSKLNPHKMARPKVRSNPSSHTAEMSATSSPSRTGTVAGIASGLSIVRRQTARSFTTAWVAIRAAPAWVAGGDSRPGNAHTTYRTGPRRPPYRRRAASRGATVALSGGRVATLAARQRESSRLLPLPAPRARVWNTPTGVEEGPASRQTRVTNPASKDSPSTTGPVEARRRRSHLSPGVPSPLPDSSLPLWRPLVRFP